MANKFKFLTYPFRKHKVYTIITLSTLVLWTTVNCVVTKVDLISNTFNTIFGDERRVVKSGDPSKAQYYKTDEGINSKEDSLKYANSINQKMCEEGFVLLKNNNSLPLTKSSKVSVYGMNSVNMVYGGSGSASKDSSDSIDLYKSLDDANIQYNPTLKSFYEKKKSQGKGRPSSPSMGDILTGFETGELALQDYDKAPNLYADSYTDAAIVVISRIGGEGYDLPTQSKNTKGRKDENEHYLELDDNEKDLLKSLCATDSPFDNVILVINCGTSMELGFLEDETTYNGKLKGALWIGTTGGQGMEALGKILNGEISPSGRLVDTYCRDFTKTPSYNNFGTNNGKGNAYLINGSEQNAHFVEYEEGIYVGYRYYETRGAIDGEAWYKENVVFPFGYGLSYTDFTWEIENPDVLNSPIQKGQTYDIKVKVTNKGSTEGKEVVQLYGHSPYTEGGIEKPEKVLVGFAKTSTLSPNESETVTITFDPYYLASYDYLKTKTENGGYVLESGNDYRLYISKNAHDSSLSIPFTVTDDIFYNEASSENSSVDNKFDDVSNYIKTNFSRSNFESTYPTSPTEEDYTTDEDFINKLTMEYYIGSGTDVDINKPWYSLRKPRQKRKKQTEEQCTTKLYQLIGKDYDDSLWDKLLNQLTYEEMRNLIGTGNFNTAQLENIGKPKTVDPDGPAGFTNFMTVIDSTATVYNTCFYVSECVIAATWNTTLVEEMGNAIGNESLIGNERGDQRSYSGWYAPACNIHRNQFGGRNWEYYSEDSYLSGMMASSVIKGAKKKGVYTYVKHFAVNEQETNRDTNGLITWVNEQALREIYLRPFEMAVKVGQTTAMMSSFNRIGTVWTGGCYELLTDILRNEWGFKGMVITDYNTNSYMYADQMIRAGGDLNLIQDKKPSSSGSIVTASHQTAIRKATKNILYTVVNSNAMNGYGEGITYAYALPYWKIALFVSDGVLACAFFIWGFFLFKSSLKKEKENK